MDPDPRGPKNMRIRIPQHWYTERDPDDESLRVHSFIQANASKQQQQDEQQRALMDRIMRGEGEERGTAETPQHSSTLLKKGHLIEDEEENFQAGVANWP
jgi:hypothetical protein